MTEEEFNIFLLNTNNLKTILESSFAHKYVKNLNFQ